MATLVCFYPTATTTEVYLEVVTALLGLPTPYSGDISIHQTYVDQIYLKVMCDMLTHITCYHIHICM